MRNVQTLPPTTTADAEVAVEALNADALPARYAVEDQDGSADGAGWSWQAHLLHDQHGGQWVAVLVDDDGIDWLEFATREDAAAEYASLLEASTAGNQ